MLILACYFFSNDFEEYASISFLFICPKLENLVLKGNPISYDEDYRCTIFRILPSLKNLDVIMMQRAPKYVCKKDMNPPDDNFDGPSATVVNFPKEFQGTYISKNDFILTYFKKCIYLNKMLT